MKFLQYAFLQNQWLWFHVLAGGLLAKFLPLWAIFLAAIAWEVIEFFATDVDKVYGSPKRFFLDAFGDVFGALLMGAIVQL